MSIDRAIIRVQMSPTAKKQLDALCERRGMTQIAVISRLVEWFVGQEELIQAGVLGQLSTRAQAKLAQDLLKRMAQWDTKA